MHDLHSKTRKTAIFVRPLQRAKFIAWFWGFGVLLQFWCPCSFLCRCQLVCVTLPGTGDMIDMALCFLLPAGSRHDSHRGIRLHVTNSAMLPATSNWIDMDRWRECQQRTWGYMLFETKRNFRRWLQKGRICYVKWTGIRPRRWSKSLPTQSLPHGMEH